MRVYFIISTLVLFINVFVHHLSFCQSGMGLTAKYGVVFPRGTYSNFSSGTASSIGLDVLLKLKGRVMLNTGLNVSNSTFSYDRDILYFAQGATTTEDPNNRHTMVKANAKLLSVSIPISVNIALSKTKFIPYLNAGLSINGSLKYSEKYDTDSSGYYLSDVIKPAVLGLSFVGGVGVRRYFDKMYISSELAYTGQLSKMSSSSKSNWIRANSFTLSLTGGFLF